MVAILDGLNGLLSGYFILVLSSIYFVTNYHINVSNDIKMIIDLLLTVTIIFYLFNLFGIVYLGDSALSFVNIDWFRIVKIYQIQILYRHITSLACYGILYLKIYFLYQDVF